MSAFVTKIPVAVDAAKKLLPLKSYIEGVKWNPDTSQIELRWSNHLLTTPLTIHTDFPLSDLKAKKIPKGIVLRELPEKKITKTVDKVTGKNEKGA